MGLHAWCERLLNRDYCDSANLILCLRDMDMTYTESVTIEQAAGARSRRIEKNRNKFIEFMLFVGGHVLWFHSALLSFPSGSRYFPILSLLFLMTEYMKYKIKIKDMTPSKETDGQILGFNYLIILLPLFSLFLTYPCWVRCGFHLG